MAAYATAIGIHMLSSIGKFLILGTCARVTVVVLSVSVTKLAATHPCLQVQNAVLKDSLWHSKRMYFVQWHKNQGAGGAPLVKN